MARQSRTTDDSLKRTPSFVCEVPLRVTPTQERTLLARLEAARQVYNACLGQVAHTRPAGARVQSLPACPDAAP